MKPEELRQWRIDHDFNTIQLAAALGVHPATIERWQTGKTPIPPYLNLALETLARRKRHI